MRGLLFLLLLLIGSLPILGVAQETHTSQGLYWGVNEGDRFYYSFSDVWRYGDRVSKKIADIQIYIYELPEIPDPFNSSFYDYYQLARRNFVPLFMNDSEADSLEIGISMFPIGNWSIITQMCEFYTYRTTSERGNYWSYLMNDTVWPFPYGEYRQEGYYEYSKTTGLLTYHTFSLINVTSGEVIRQKVMARILQPVEVVLGGGAAISIVLIGLFIIRRKRK